MSIGAGLLEDFGINGVVYIVTATLGVLRDQDVVVVQGKGCACDICTHLISSSLQ